MKVETQPFSSSFTALILKVTGILLIVGFLVESVIVTIPPNFADSQWFSSWLTQWVSRGVLPMVGIAFVIFGSWIEAGLMPSSDSARRGWVFWSALLAALLAIAFLLFAPLYFNSSRQISATKTREINDQATTAGNQLNALLEQQQRQVTAVISNDEQYDRLQQEIEKADQLPEEQKTKLKQLQTALQQVKNDPKLLDQRVAAARNEGQARIRQRQQQEIAKAATEVRRSRIQVISGSLLLAIGFAVIAVTGLSSGSQRTGRRAR